MVTFAPRSPRSALAIGTLLMALALPAAAMGQATRTWVSGTGDDANPCSRTAPCKTFAGAISKTAAKGEINVIDTGGFGAVTITKSITIRSVNIEAGIVVSGTNGIIINAGPTDRVRLVGLNLDGLTTGLSGIRILAGGSVRVEDCDINEFNAGINFASTTPNSQLIVQNTSIDQNSNSGITINPAANGLKATIRNTSMDDNGNGFAVNGASFSASATITHSDMSDNSGQGILSSGAQATVRIGSNTITDNATGLLSQSGGKILSFGDNLITGNGTDGAPTGPLSRL